MERILSLLGLAHKAGRVEIGEEPVGSAARAKKARIILVAGDAAASSVRRAMGFANTGSCLCLVIPATKEQLGRALGRTSCAMAAVTDIGFADAVTGKLAALDPEKFQSAAQRMTVKAQRARERRQEQLAHEKGRDKDLALYAKIERMAPQLIAEERKIFKGVSPNVDFYSGLTYSMLGIPEELFTPIFAIARIVGWSAHRLEELINMDKIIRPAYMSVQDRREYVRIDDRG